MDFAKKTFQVAYEEILSVCSGLRRTPEKTPEDTAYNDALGDLFDFIILNNAEYLLPGTVSGGLWVRTEKEE